MKNNLIYFSFTALIIAGIGFTSVWIDIGEENISDNIKSSKEFLDFQTKDLSLFLDEVNRGIL